MPNAASAGTQELVARLGPDYLARYSKEEVALHLRLAHEVSSARPVRVHVAPAAGGRFDVTFVGLDFFSEFALLCGTLAARGLDIEAGHVSTSASAGEPASPPRPGPPRRPPAWARDTAARIIVDVFRVSARGAACGAAELERTLESDREELVGLMAEGRGEEARQRLDRRLAERFSQAPPPSGALAPLEIRFDNEREPRWTLMEVRGSDTPGFLYALATALALRDIYVQQVEITSVGSEACDRFLVARRDGRKLEDASELQRLRAAVALIKQFAHLLPVAPDPARALRSFGQLVDRLLDARQEPALELLATPQGLREIAQLLGASAFLWEDFLRLQAEHLLPVLGSWHRRALRSRSELLADLERRLQYAASFDERRRLLNDFKDEEMLLADMRHLLDPEVDLVAFSNALTDLAEAVVETALAACLARCTEAHGAPHDEAGRPCVATVLGLGKFGGRELGYASDIELLFVYDRPGLTPSGLDAGVFFEEVAREISAFITARQEGIFHVDLRLRPHGAKGPLASPLHLLREYYREGGGAAPFERQALIKLRRVAGDPKLGAEVERLRDDFVWGAAPWNREDALHLRDRQSRELVPAGRFNVKYSPGALVEVEYAVQYLQIAHGREQTALRTPSTLEGLERLAAAGLVEPATQEALRSAYVFWRALADALRMVRGNARDLLLPEPGSDELRFLARRTGYSGPDWAEAACRLQSDLERHREAVALFFNRRFRR